MMRQARHRPLSARKSRGAAAVEFAFIFPVLIALMLGIMEMSRLYWANHALSQAVNDTGRYAMINTTVSNLQISNHLNSVLMGIDPAQVTVTITNETVSGKNFMTIRGDYNFAPVVSYLGFSALTISESTRFPRG